MTLQVQGQAEFDLFKGSIYKIPSDSLWKGYYPNVVNEPLLKNIEMESLNIPNSNDYRNIFGISRNFAYGVIFTSRLKVEESGSYEIRLTSDDGSILWIDDYKVIDNDLPHGMRLKTDTVGLFNRVYTIRIWYYDAAPTLYGLILNQKKIGALDLCDTLGQSKVSLSLLSDVLFETDKYEIRNEGIANLDSIVEVIRNQKIDTLEIIGHTDSIGSQAYNRTLSKHRAESVFEYLASRLSFTGMEVIVDGKGDEDPIETNNTAKGRAKNRRVDIIMKFKSK